MWIVWLGSVSFGMMWGWLVANRTVGFRRRSFLNAIVIILTTLLLSAAIAWKIEALMALPFLISALLAFCIHLGWMHQLRVRYHPDIRE
jgi:Na+-transporting methylmalonyl-CoA/oxaloacetate decarboxylase beta subunit